MFFLLWLWWFVGKNFLEAIHHRRRKRRMRIEYADGKHEKKTNKLITKCKFH